MRRGDEYLSAVYFRRQVIEKALNNLVEGEITVEEAVEAISDQMDVLHEMAKGLVIPLNHTEDKWFEIAERAAQ